MKALHASVCAQSLSCVRLFVTLWTVAHQAPLGILQARILEWVAMPSFRGYSQPRDQTRVSFIGRHILYHCATWEALCLAERDINNNYH